jgi:hypothetical protein
VACFLAMTKLSNEVRPIIMREALYWLTSCVLCLQFHEAFVTHFSPHQFGVIIKDGCEVVIHGTFILTGLFFSWMWQMSSIQCKKGSYFKNFVQQMEISYKSSPLLLHSMHLDHLCFTIIVIVKMMSQSSHLPWELVKVILWRGGTIHFSPL